MRRDRPRILLVDDTPQNLDILVELLAGHGRLSVALNGDKALELARTPPGPDLVLLDVMMPGLDGYEVCRRLKADPATREIPVIFVTALGEATDEMKGFELGAVDYVHKPFNPILVRARVEAQLELKAARDQLRDHNAILEERVAAATADLRSALERLEDSSLETLLRLSRAAEFKDDDTGAHVLRMSRYSAAIARTLGLDDAWVALLLHAAPMHDIGKIGIPDRILLKPGRLDAAEWEIMRTHCRMGAEILAGSDSEVIRLGEEIALTHHEKWNGQGYPHGLVGDSIPLSGRIVAVADVFDALTSRRPYKEPFSVEKSLRIMREGSGSHFDPEVLEGFLSILDEVLEIKQGHQDGGVSWLRQVAGGEGAQPH